MGKWCSWTSGVDVTQGTLSLTMFLAPQPSQVPATREPPGAVHVLGHWSCPPSGGGRPAGQAASAIRLVDGPRKCEAPQSICLGQASSGLSPLCLTAAFPQKEAVSAFPWRCSSPRVLLVFQARRGSPPEPPLPGGLLLRRLQHLHARPEPVETGESPGSGREASDAGHPAPPLSRSRAARGVLGEAAGGPFQQVPPARLCIPGPERQVQPQTVLTAMQLHSPL